MNILFYLVPKREVVYIYDDFTVHQALETLEMRRYASVPIITRKGTYVGSLTEGDLLWGFRNMDVSNKSEMEKLPIRHIKRLKDNQPVNINCDMEDLIMTSMHQNFIPVVDDNGTFIGIVTRKSIISYCYEQFKKGSAETGKNSIK